MAISIKDRYPSKVDTTDAAYPQGKARNVTVSLDGTGTPFEKDLVNDIMGFQQAIYKEAGITPSGTPDTADVCQQLDGLKVVQDKRSINDLSQPYIFPTVAAFKASLIEFPDGKVIHLTDRGADFTKITGNTATLDQSIIFSLGVNQSIEYAPAFDERINLIALGGLNDRTTDNTNLVQAAIDLAFSLGSADTGLGDNWVARDVYIPADTKWRYQDIASFFNGTTDSANATVAHLISSSFVVDELVGAFLWNTTDKSYGTITSNTVDTVTVKELYLGSSNTFTNGDSIVISKHKVGVNIFDDSKYDWYNSSFTAQSKVYIQCDAPHKTSANEQHLVGTYHPANIVENHAPSDMEKRASFLVRHKNPNTEVGDKALDRFFQFGMNHTQNQATPDKLDFIIIGGGHPYTNGIPDKTVVYSSEMFGIASVNQFDRRIGLGQRPLEGYAVAQKWWDVSSDNIWRIETGGATLSKMQFFYDNVFSTELIAHETEGITGFGGRIDNDVVLQQHHNGTTVTNTTASVGTTSVYLPPADAPEGFKVTITRTNATFNMVVRVSLAPTGDQIFGTTAIDKLISASAIGDSITLMSDGAGVWYPSSIIGTWTFT